MSETWKNFYAAGIDYWNFAKNSAKRPDVFNAEIVYNVVGMAIEKLFMALLVYHDRLPYNHTLTDLVEAVKHIHNVDALLEEKLKYMDSLQEICAIHSLVIKKITEDDRMFFLETGQLVNDLVHEALQGNMESLAARQN